MRRPLPVSVSPEELSAIDPRWREVAARLAELQSRDLTYWEEFPIELPATAFAETPPEDLSGIFQAPTDDELEAIARGPDGALKRLSTAQLTQLKETGQLTIPSERYPGQQHVWALSALLQRGRGFIRERQRHSFAAALRHARYLAARRINSATPISLTRGLKQVSRDLYHLLDLALGLPQRRPKHYEHELQLRLQEARRAATLEGFTPVPNSYQWSREGATLDLALQDQELMEKAWPVIERLFVSAHEEHQRAAAALREEILNRLREEQTAPRELASRLSEGLHRALRELLLNKLQQSKALAALSPGLPAALAAHARAVILIHEEERALEALIEQKREAEYARLKKEHPTLSRIPEWRGRQLAATMPTFSRDAKRATEQKIAAQLQAQGLSQEALLFSRGLTFQREQEPSLREKLSAERAPANVFVWRRRIWRSRDWKIHRDDPPTGPPVFSVDKEQRQEVTTERPLWRFHNALWRAGSFLNNGLHWLLLQNLWRGPLGLRALFGSAPFSATLTLDPKNGTLSPCIKKTPTFASRLRTLARDIQSSRRNFEAKPDTGIIGKSLSRWFNRAWNYLIKGLFGALLILVGQPILTALNLVITSVLALSAVLWAPLGSLGVMLLNVLLYDTEATTSCRALPVVQRAFTLALSGVGQAALALLAAAMFHPLIALLFFVLGGARAILRAGYDDLVRWFILRRLGRVPASSGFLARRISGPGLSAEFYFQVRPELVILLARANLERIELQLYQEKTQAQISEPLLALQRFTAQVFGLFSRSPEPAERLAEPVQESTARHTKRLDKAGARRAAALARITTIQEAERLRQTREELRLTLARLAPMVQSFCEERLLPRLTPEEQDAFFLSRNLSRGDFSGFTRWLLATTISPGLLVPLEDADHSLRLLVEPMNLARYLGALQQDKPIGDDLDRVTSNEELFVPSNEETPPTPHELFQTSSGYAELLYLPEPTLDP